MPPHSVHRRSARPLRVAVFAKQPLPGFAKTRLAAALGDAAAVRLYQSFAADTFRCLAAVRGARKFLYFDPPGAAAACAGLIPPSCRRDFELRPQSSGGLGERLAVAFDDLLAEPGSRALVVGTDCPLLDASDITGALAALARHDLVIGPSRDGGYYLIGMRRPEPELFQAMPWSSDRVLAETLARARERRLATHLLRERGDIDTPADLERLRPEILEAWDDAIAGRRRAFPVSTLRSLSWSIDLAARRGP